MFCRKCGFEMPDEASFCPSCGFKVASASPTVTKEDGWESSAASVSEDQPSAKKPRKKGAIIAAVLAVVVVCAAVGVGVWWKMDQDAKAAAAQAAWERAHATLVTSIPVEAPDFDSSSTGIPVQIIGTDLDGNEVDEVQFMQPGSTQVTMLQGSYDLAFPGGYFTGDGQVAKSQATTAHVDVFVEDAGDTGDAANSTSASQQGENAPAATVEQTVVYALVAPLDVTDEDIAEVVKWAEQDPEDNGKAEQLRQNVAAKRDEAFAEKKRQEEEAAERARVEARMAEITQTAEDFLYYLYDTKGSRGGSIVSERKGMMMGGFTNGGSLQSGWPNTRMLSFNSIEAIDENTVAYSLTYQDQYTGPWSDEKQDSGTISFDENGLIDQWYPAIRPDGRLIK